MLRAMYRRACAVLLVVLGACQSGSGKPPPVAAGLRADLEQICNAIERSGAGKLEAADRAYMMASWLGANVRSDEGHRFLQDFARLGTDKAARRKLLEDTAARVGLARCPLVDEWR
jgi:hypothetical protein